MTSVNQHVRGLDESHVSALCIDTEAVRRVKRGEGRGGEGVAAGANVAPKYTQDCCCPDGDLSLTGPFTILKHFSSKCCTLRKKDLYAFSQAAKLFIGLEPVMASNLLRSSPLL